MPFVCVLSAPAQAPPLEVCVLFLSRQSVHTEAKKVAALLLHTRLLGPLVVFNVLFSC